MGGDGDGDGRGSNFLRVVLLLSFLLCFVCVGILVKPTVTKTISGTTTIQLATRRIIETERHSLQGTNLNYVSKRRVPSEPDPIHNREAGEHMETRIRA